MDGGASENCRIKLNFALALFFKCVDGTKKKHRATAANAEEIERIICVHYSSINNSNNRNSKNTGPSE